MDPKSAKAIELAPHNRRLDASYVQTWTATDLVAQTDEELMLAYQRGEEAAFDELFARFRDRVYGFFARTMRDTDAATDLFQQTFLKVHQARGSYDSTRPFATWLFAIAANLRKDELKRWGRRPGDRASAPEEELAALPALMPTPEGALEESEKRRNLEEALACLPESQREVIILHKLEGLSFPEVASVLGEAVEAVKGRAFRGYRALRRLLDARWSR